MSITEGMQFLQCPDISRRADRFIKEEHLREIISGVSMSQFDRIVKEYVLNIVSSAGHYVVITKAMPYNYFDDYTHNRRVYYMLNELLRKELYSLLNDYAGGEVFEISNNSMCLIINDFHSHSARKYQERFEALMKSIRRLTDDGMTALFIGRHVDSPTDFNAVYRECINAKRMRVFYGEESILSVYVLRQKRSPTNVEELEKCISVVREFSLITPFHQLEAAINEIFISILKSSANINYYYYSCSAINVIYDTFCQRYGITPERRSMSRCFDKYVTVEEIAEHYVRIFRNAQKQLQDNCGMENLTARRMVAYIEQNYSSDISLDTLAAFVGFSPSYTSRYFHSHIGKTFSAYLTEFRIRKAKELIRQTKRPIINEIAGAVGYRNAQFFSRIFRQATGQTPTEYAAIIRQR